MSFPTDPDKTNMQAAIAALASPLAAYDAAASSDDKHRIAGDRIIPVLTTYRELFYTAADQSVANAFSTADALIESYIPDAGKRRNVIMTEFVPVRAKSARIGSWSENNADLARSNADVLIALFNEFLP